ncbi:MAG TPA: 3-phosphoshikimate 1-carboxyvinyltransferase [Polyangiaceae bacterium]|nr:3-phosphoshikimate 1-carboxyvinyltransferase [Polyangiaceae bacterium]
MASRLIVRPPSRPLSGSVPVPSDRSITHRALLLAALSNGPCELRGFAYGSDNLQMLRALSALGVRHEDDQKGTLKIRGGGLRGLSEPKEPLNCGHSPTIARLLTGVLSGQPFKTTLAGSDTNSRRPMRAVTEPLVRRGARIVGTPHPEDAHELCLPLEVGPLATERLEPIDYVMSRPSDHAKGALLFAGLFASGPTLIHEPVLSRDHTERMFDALGLPVQAMGSMVSLHPPADPLAIRGFDADIPGDISAAAFILAAAQLVPESSVSTRRTGLNPTRTGILVMIRLFGGRTGITPTGDALGEPFGEVSSRGAPLRGIKISGELALRGMDEIPVACVLAARARGVTEISDVAELREESPDRLTALAGMLRAFGVSVSEKPDGLLIEGQPERPLAAARVSSGGDHRMAMAAALLALAADGESVIDEADPIAVSFPRFVGTLRALGAEIEVQK